MHVVAGMAAGTIATLAQLVFSQQRIEITKQFR